MHNSVVVVPAFDLSCDHYHEIQSNYSKLEENELQLNPWMDGSNRGRGGGVGKIGPNLSVEAACDLIPLKAAFRLIFLRNLSGSG